MIKFYNKIENKQFLAIVECLKRVCDFNYKGYDVSGIDYDKDCNISRGE